MLGIGMNRVQNQNQSISFIVARTMSGYIKPASQGKNPLSLIIQSTESQKYRQYATIASFNSSIPRKLTLVADIGIS